MRSHVGHFSDVLSQSVGAETAWPPCADQWNEDNPFWGNCLVATLVFWGDQDFKGNLIPCLAGEDELWHFQYTSPETGTKWPGSGEHQGMSPGFFEACAICCEYKVS